MSKEENIIIKKIKKGGHGHHGGAWKVAYADFVTAMMAFFLLLWLLSSTPVESLEGLAEYFSPTLGVQGKLGIGFEGGKSPNSEGLSSGDWASVGLVFGAPPSGPIIKLPEKPDNKDEESDSVTLEKIAGGLMQSLDEGESDSSLKDSVSIKESPLGMEISISDSENRSMFKEKTAVMEPHTKRIVSKISSIIRSIPNYIEITGHTKHYNDKDFNNWELSTERADSIRQYMVKSGAKKEQVIRIAGEADNNPIDVEYRSNPVNSRVTILLLKKSYAPAHKQSTPEDTVSEIFR